MAKSRDAFRTISEVADWLDTPAHVLRFWESKFTQVKPVKRAGGRRYYRPADMELLGGIKKLLHDDGMTIKGVQKILREQGIRHVSSLCAQSVEDGPDESGTMLDDAPFIDVEPDDRDVEPVDFAAARTRVAADPVDTPPQPAKEADTAPPNAPEPDAPAEGLAPDAPTDTPARQTGEQQTGAPTSPPPESEAGRADAQEPGAESVSDAAEDAPEAPGLSERNLAPGLVTEAPEQDTAPVEAFRAAPAEEPDRPDRQAATHPTDPDSLAPDSVGVPETAGPSADVPPEPEEAAEPLPDAAIPPEPPVPPKDGLPEAPPDAPQPAQDMEADATASPPPVADSSETTGAAPQDWPEVAPGDWPETLPGSDDAPAGTRDSAAPISAQDADSVVDDAPETVSAQAAEPEPALDEMAPNAHAPMPAPDAGSASAPADLDPDTLPDPAPGPLAQLARIDRLSAWQVAAVAADMDRLAALRDRLSAPIRR